jgi:peroxiredoxin
MIGGAAMSKDVHATRQLNVGDAIARRALTSVSGKPISMPDSHRLVHLQFRRFAGCPVCNLHLQSFSRRDREITAAGIREIIVFHSTADDLRPYTADLPFAVIADPDKRLYLEFGVESSPRALLDPRAWPAILRGIIHSFISIVRDKQPVPSLTPHGGRFRLPADFLIAPDGRVLARRYGNHADDQWSVEEVVTLARGVGAMIGRVFEGSTGCTSGLSCSLVVNPRGSSQRCDPWFRRASASRVLAWSHRVDSASR